MAAMSPAERILDLFATNTVPAGGRIHKRAILDAIKALGLDMTEVRGAWHELMGNGFIRQMGNELELTDRGGQALYGSDQKSP